MIRGSGRVQAVLTLLLAAMLALPAMAVDTYALTGKVVRVSDGDSLTLLMGRHRHRIRLASIDAPETGSGKKRPAQPYSQASKKFLADMVAGKVLSLRCYEADHYGRHVCDVPLPDGRLASHELVAHGLAWANMQGGGKYLRDPALKGLEQQARERKLGLWQRPGAIAPWDWRWQCWKVLESGKTSPIC